MSELPHVHLPHPLEDPGWAQLCQHPRWKFPTDETAGLGGGNDDTSGLCYGETVLHTDPSDGWGEQCHLVPVPAPRGMHRGAVAPSWVLATMPTEVSEDSLQSYQRRLICAVTGRFVLMDAWGGAVGSGSGSSSASTIATGAAATMHQEETLSPDESLRASQGLPVVGRHYRWRYWDNAGNVYDDVGREFQAEFGSNPTATVLLEHPSDNGEALPGDFRDGLVLWMRQAKAGQPSEMEEFLWKHFGKGQDQTTQVGRFWECLWAWKHLGSTGHWDWDESLDLLAQTAGVSEITHMLPHENSVLALHEFDLDALAAEKLWEKIPLQQMPFVSYQRGYQRDGMRLTFNLATGMAESTLSIPMQGVFRRRCLVQNSAEAAALLDSLPQWLGCYHHHQGEQHLVEPRSGGKRKAEPLGRTCAQCWESKTLDEFSKLQQRQGSAARCHDCMSLSA